MHGLRKRSGCGFIDNPPRHGEGDREHIAKGGGGVPQAGGSLGESPLRQPAAAPSPFRGGSNLLALAVECAR
ncbi:hypothetical protein EI044_26455, partial [Escherichia coli]|nr:hypothetical protein [Escherichia coli]